MGGIRLTEHLWYIYSPLENHTAYTAYHSAMVVELTNYNFPYPARKVAIGSLSTSALAALKVRLATSLEHRSEKQPRRHLRGDFLCIFLHLLWFYWGNYGDYTQVVPFSKYRQCIITARAILTAYLRGLIHQVRVYMFGSLTRLVYSWNTSLGGRCVSI